MIMGSPMYMAPEQIEGKPVHTRTDIYGLGMTLYHALCGKAPFSGELNQVLMAHIVKMPPPFNQHLPEEAISKNLEWIIFKAIQKDPDERFDSIYQMRQALKLCAEAISNNRECSLSIIDSKVFSRPGTQEELNVLAKSKFSIGDENNSIADTISPTFRSPKNNVPAWFPTFLAVCATLVLFSGGIVGGIFLYKEMNSDQFEEVQNNQNSEQKESSDIVHEKKSKSQEDHIEEQKPVSVSINTSRSAKTYLITNGKRSKNPICTTNPCIIEMKPDEKKRVVIIRRGYQPETIELDGKVTRLDVELKRKSSIKTTKTTKIDEPLIPDIYKSD